MRIFGAIVFVLLLFGYIFVVYEYMKSDNDNLDVASAILCENALKYGRVDIIEKLAPLVKNTYAKSCIENTRYYAKNFFVPLPELLKNRPRKGSFVTRDRLLCNEIIKRFYHIDNYMIRKNLRSFEYAISFLQNTPIKAKILYMIGSMIDEKRYILEANKIVHSKSSWSVEYTDILIDIAEIALENKNTDDYFRYMDITPYSYRKAGAYYLVSKNKDILKRAEILQKEKKISSASSWNMRAILPSVKYIYKDVSTIYSSMKNTSICVYQGGSSYKLHNKKEYKYPSIMLLSYLTKNNELMEKYINLTLSDDAYETVKVRYLDYVHYSNIAFYIMRKQEFGIKLLDRIRNPMQKAMLLKKTMRYISEDKDLLDILTEMLIALYDTNVLSKDYLCY